MFKSAKLMLVVSVANLTLASFGAKANIGVSITADLLLPRMQFLGNVIYKSAELAETGIQVATGVANAVTSGIEIANQCGLESFQFQVGNADLEVKHIRVAFKGRAAVSFPVNATIAVGGYSPVINIKQYSNYCVENVYINGKSRINNTGLSKVYFYGVKRFGPANVTQTDESKFESNELRMLGSAQFPLRTNITQRISLGQCGRSENLKTVVGRDAVTGLKFRAIGNNVNIERIIVRYRNTQSQEIRVRDNFREGSWSANKNIAGDVRCIDSIEVEAQSYDLGGGGVGPGRLEVFGFKGDFTGRK